MVVIKAVTICYNFSNFISFSSLVYKRFVEFLRKWCKGFQLSLHGSLIYPIFGNFVSSGLGVLSLIVSLTYWMCYFTSTLFQS